MTDAATPSHNIVLRAGRFDDENGPGAAGLKALFDSVARERPERLVIHFHGGLISREAGEAAATTLAPYYRSARATPMFVIWESGWLEVTRQQLSAIFKEGVFQRILRRVTQLVRGKFDKELGPEGGKGPADELPLPFEGTIHPEIEKGKTGQPIFDDLPLDQLSPGIATSPDENGLTPVERQQIQQEIENDFILQNEVTAIAPGQQPPAGAAARDVTAAQPATTLMDQRIIDEIFPPQPGGEASRSLLSTVMLVRHIARVVGAVVWRVAHKRDHGVYLTIVEEILREFYVRAAGKFLWDGMKAEIAEAFGPAPQCGGTALVDALCGLWEGGFKPKLTLVGHSAGAIYVARLLKELDAKLPADFSTDVVLIAAACTLTTLGDAIKTAGRRISGLRIFGMGDRLERQDQLVPLVYPASLLYFVAGVLEEERDAPLAGMQRYYASGYEGEGFDAIAAVKSFDYLKRDHAFAWSEISGFEGANCDMIAHGGWVNAQQTRASVMHIIEKGYGYT
jgi:hypothetical protein